MLPQNLKKSMIKCSHFKKHVKDMLVVFNVYRVNTFMEICHSLETCL